MDPAQTLMQCVLQLGSGTDLVLICGAHAAFISATTVSLNGLFSSAVCTIRKEMLNIQMFSSRRNIFLFMFS